MTVSKWGYAIVRLMQLSNVSLSIISISEKFRFFLDISATIIIRIIVTRITGDKYECWHIMTIYMKVWEICFRNEICVSNYMDQLG